METKVCNKCGRELPVESFGKNHTCKDGRCGTCKDCKKAYTKEWQKKNKEKKKMEKFKIKGETIARTIALFVVLINTILTSIGLNPLPYSETEVYEAISTVVTIIIALWA